MDFYKKMVKPKDVTSILSEKEYKCASLQAITNEAIKENNKKRLKELVDEINGHLVDLRAIKDPKTKDKSDKLIKQFEECLIKILNNNSVADILTPISAQLQELQNLAENAMKLNNIEELNKLAERMERNIMIVNEIPEVKCARASQNSDDKILDLVNKYTSLLNKVLTHVKAQKNVISHPVLKEVNNEQIIEEKTSPPATNKIGLTEVEEKLKLMRQKRLNRLSTFVIEQSKLSEERSKENSAKNSAVPPSRKSLENSTAATEIDLAIKSIQSPEITRQPFYNKSENAFRQNEKKAQISRESVVGSSFGKGTILGGIKEKCEPKSHSITNNIVSTQSETMPAKLELTQPASQANFGTSRSEMTESKRDFFIGPRNSFGKSGITRSFAERQIEIARNQSEKPKALSGNSTKTTPPRTPTQIRKFLNSINSCVLGGNATHKSIEDLPNEFNSQFEQELKKVQLKSTGLASKLDDDSFKADDNKKMVNAAESFKKRDNKDATKTNLATPVQPPVVSKLPKPVAAARSTVKKPNEDYEEVNFSKSLQIPFKIGSVTKSASQSHISTPSEENPSQQNQEQIKTWRKSLDFDSVMIRQESANNETIAIKRDSNNLNSFETEPPRCSFSTFRTSTDVNSFENPIYEFINPSATNQIAVDDLLATATATNQSDFNTLDLVTQLNRKRERKVSCRSQLSNEGNKFHGLDMDIAKLEFIIKVYKGLKRDDDYLLLDKVLSKYFVKVNEIYAETAFDKIEKAHLMKRLNKAHDELKNKVAKNEDIMKAIFAEQVEIIGRKYGLA